MGHEMRHAGGQTGDLCDDIPDATHDMRPAFDAVATAGALSPDKTISASGDHALLLVHLGGDPFTVRLGEDIGREVSVAKGAIIVLGAHALVTARLSSPIRALRIEFGEDLMRSAPVPMLGRRRGGHVVRSGGVAHRSAIAAAAGVLALDMALNVGGFAFRSALTLAIIEGLAHDDALVRRLEDDASRFACAGIERAIRLIETNLATGLPLTALAAGAGVSPFHLSRSFRRVTGMSIREYVRERRLREACRLLSETRKPLAEIAYECGFSSQSRMTTVFRQALDVTPLAFRNTCWHGSERAPTG